MARLEEAFMEVEENRGYWAKVYERMCPNCDGEIEELDQYATKVIVDGRAKPIAVEVLYTLKCLVCHLSFAYQRIKQLPGRRGRKHWGAGVPHP